MTSRLVIVGLFYDINFSFLLFLIDAVLIIFIITIVRDGFKIGTKRPYLEYIKHYGDTMHPIYEEKKACDKGGPLLDCNK